jgi:hypothetical protein
MIRGHYVLSEEKRTPDRPDWRDIEQYRHLLDLDRAGWAWEWLRRRPGYVGDDDGKNSSRDLSAKPQPAMIRRVQLDPARQWGLCFC